MGLINQALGGDRRALARLASILERGDDAADVVNASLPSAGASTQVIGVTGPPGAGKSSIINRLIASFLAADETVAVVLVDPSSPFTGGAVLGDRVRLAEWADDRVYVRSVASRGWEGGLAPSIAFMLRLFAAVGFRRVIVESVGVGQDAVDIRELADTVVVVQVPNLGDTVQTLKAGVLEIADLYVVNKADLTGSQTTVRELNALLQLAPHDSDRFAPRVLAVSALDGSGIDQVVSTLNEHRRWLSETGAESPSDERQAAWYLKKRLQQDVRALATDSAFAAITKQFVAGQLGSRSATRQISELLGGR